jgi:hypothetical protein
MAGIMKLSSSELLPLCLEHAKRLLRASNPAMVTGIGAVHHHFTGICPFD